MTLKRSRTSKHQCFTKLPTPFPCLLSIDCRPSQSPLSKTCLRHRASSTPPVLATSSSVWSRQHCGSHNHNHLQCALRTRSQSRVSNTSAMPTVWSDAAQRPRSEAAHLRRTDSQKEARDSQHQSAQKSRSHPLVRIKLCQHPVMSLCRSPLPPPTAVFIKYRLQPDLLRTSDSSMRLFFVQPWCLRFPLRSRHLHTFNVGFLRQQSIPFMILATVLPLLIDPSTVVLYSLFNVACTQLHTCVCNVFGFNLTHVFAFHRCLTRSYINNAANATSHLHGAHMRFVDHLHVLELSPRFPPSPFSCRASLLQLHRRLKPT